MANGRAPFFRNAWDKTCPPDMNCKKILIFAPVLYIPMKRSTLILALAFLALAACRHDRPAQTDKSNADSLTAAGDSFKNDSTQNPPKNADGLFDDFIYSFMGNARFQLDRTDFPLSNIVDGVDTPIARSQWKHDRLFSTLDTYTVIFDSERSAKAQKETLLDSVVVEWVYLDKSRVKQFHFRKKDGQWRLSRIEQHDMSKNANSDFYNFYRRFSTDRSYQTRHIMSPFTFKTQDFDNFQTIEGVLEVEQWPDYRPELPKGTITNINYGQHYANAKRRVVMICSQSGGMGCALTFVRTNKGWMLEKLEN